MCICPRNHSTCYGSTLELITIFCTRYLFTAAARIGSGLSCITITAHCFPVLTSSQHVPSTSKAIYMFMVCFFTAFAHIIPRSQTKTDATVVSPDTIGSGAGWRDYVENTW